MHVIYTITYIPHLQTNYPKYYIGSKFNYKPGYLGSVSSKKKFPFTGELSLALWWKNQTKSNPENFIVNIIHQFDNIDAKTLAEEEQKVQIFHKCVENDEYFNQAYACGKFVSQKNSENTKKIKSEKLKIYYNSKEGYEKRIKTSERNKLIKSEEMKKRWANSEFLIAHSKRMRQPKSDNFKEKVSVSNSLNIEYKGKIYKGFKMLKTQTGVTSFLYKKYYLAGYDPEVNINNKHPKKVPL